MSKGHNTGKLGEDIALRYLQEQGYTVRERNWHCAAGEIDIVASNHDVLVFVEVRTRHSVTTEAAFASISLAKRQRVLHAVYEYLKVLPESDTIEWRIDVIGVALQRGKRPVIQHVENAFDW